MKLIIFDLDETLVTVNKKGLVVPRQTYHKLNLLLSLGYKMSIITYNPIPHIVLNSTSLLNYVDYFIYGNRDRNKLFEDALHKYEKYENYEIHYVDDRIDNIEVIKKHFPKVITHHCTSVYKLYECISNIR